MESKLIAFILILNLYTTVTNTASSSMQPCTCNVGKESFGDCKSKNPTDVWGNHYDEEVGLHTDCLPPVPENAIKCFRWRVARECGKDRVDVKCSLKHRAALDATFETTQNGQSLTFLSPGFFRQNTSQPKGAYFNRNFCIFNISLDCPNQMVELQPLERTNSLSDSDTCQDYLSFHTNSSTRPHFKLCGTQIMDATQYRLLPSSSFYGVLWTNHNKNERGRFEIEARCKMPLEADMGSGIVSQQYC